jgi:signal transduction histidine kinase
VNRRRTLIWITFWSGALLVLLALAAASVSVHRLERRNDQNRALAQRQETIRLALWRMDSRIAPLIALEAARPDEDYARILASQLQHRALSDTAAFSGGADEGMTIPTEPRAQISNAFANAYFQYEDQGEPVVSDTDALPVARSARRLLRSAETPQRTPGDETRESESAQVLSEQRARDDSSTDYIARQQLTETYTLDQAPPSADRAARKAAPTPATELASALEDPAPPRVSAIEPRWITAPDTTRQLVLVRRITRDDETITQGVWLDWPSLRADLLALVDDILPTSTLAPITAAAPPPGSYQLATLPVAFTPGGAIALPEGRLTPALLAMLAAWIATLAAIIAAAVVLRAVLSLSDRRARFVSAVTHELRTPLTSFRLYAQMLADGMVTDESAKREYLETLRRESDRLTGIVENVLEYARLARHRASKSKAGERTLTPGELMAQLVPPMSRRAEEAGLDLVIDDQLDESSNRTLTLDPRAVERIMMNLVENACKYAAPTPDPAAHQRDESADESDTRIHLDASITQGTLTLLLADHGPGVPPRDRRRIFAEFTRGSAQQSHDRAGLGLGLALSRALAREMGGDLTLVTKRNHGAEFQLTLPLDDEP